MKHLTKIIFLIALVASLQSFGQSNNFKWVLQSTYTASGTDTYTASIPGLTAYGLGLEVKLLFTNAPTGTSTININSIGAITLKKNGSTNLSAGDIAAGQTLRISYDGTNFQVLGLGGSGGGSGDMVLASTQTNSGAKTFLDGTLKLRNAANDGSASLIYDVGTFDIGYRFNYGLGGSIQDILTNESQLDWNQIISTPSTLSGYGITDNVLLLNADNYYTTSTSINPGVAGATSFRFGSVNEIKDFQVYGQTVYLNASFGVGSGYGSLNLTSASASLGRVGGSSIGFSASGTTLILGSDAIGDSYQRDAGGYFSRLASVATGNALISGGVGTVNSWGKIGLTTHVSGILPVANGGTGTASPGLVAGTNITSITGTWPNQTINASGGGITNGAANTEFAISNGTNLIGGKIFTPANGDLDLGDSGLTGFRTIKAKGNTGGGASLFLEAEGTNSVFVKTNGVNIAYVNYLGELGLYGVSGTSTLKSSDVGGASTPHLLITSGNVTSGNGDAGNVSIQTGSPLGTGVETSLNLQSRATGKLGFFNSTAVVKQSAVTTSQGIADALTAYGLLPSSTISGSGLTYSQVKAISNKR